MDDTDQSVEIARDASVGRNSIAALNETLNSASALGKDKSEIETKANLEEQDIRKRDSLANVSIPGKENNDDLNVSLDEPEMPAFDEEPMPDVEAEEEKTSDKENVQIETTVIDKEGAAPKRRRKLAKGDKPKKRKIRFKLDEETVLSNAQLRANRMDTSDIVVTRLPVTYRLMAYKKAREYGLRSDAFRSIQEKLMHPSDGEIHPALLKLYQRPMFIKKRKRTSVPDIEIARDAPAQKRASVSSPEGNDQPGSEHDMSAHYEADESRASSRASLGANFGPGTADDEDISLNVTLDDPEMPEFEDDEEEEEKKEDDEEEESDDGEEDEVERLGKEEQDMMVLELLGQKGHLLKIAQGRSKKTAAALFYKLLELKTKDQIEISQEGPFADISYYFVK